MRVLREHLKNFGRRIKYALAVRRVFLSIERLFCYPYAKRLFKKKLGYPLNLKNPRSFNEKINYKKLFDRDPLLVRTTDKYAVRGYVREILGDEAANNILIPLFCVVDRPNDIPFGKLPEECIMKVTNSSGGNHIIEEEKPTDRKSVVAFFHTWFIKSYGFYKHEWAYSQIKPRIVIEQLIRDNEGMLVQDYKFHVFHGKCKFIHTTPKVNGVRTGTRSLFTPEWELLDVASKHPKGSAVPPPPQLKEMLALVEKLAAPFDYVRVDLYSASGKTYFGELTHYHESGLAKIEPREADFTLGEYWNLVPHYWEQRPPFGQST